jgi:hypothetical protein
MTDDFQRVARHLVLRKLAVANEIWVRHAYSTGRLLPETRSRRIRVRETEGIFR